MGPESPKRSTPRIQYQKRYNFVHRIGRRKIGKAAREREERTRAEIIDGEHIPYKNSFTVRQRLSHDPRRTPAMAAEESAALRACDDLKWSLIENGTHHWARDAPPAFRQLLDDSIASAKAYMHASPGASAEELHRHRRLVAGYAQLLEFAEQGVHVDASAAGENTLIWGGRRVNLRKFKQVFGF
ncbi:hypothetical protein FA95DRAFT_1612873 [Auriscalpium vulgare]|uniref:Uncharacterized protein n=1 Tax=Auriscalpium vulgare TaxID=40419 RepID=A0ACB8R4W8_9AGAM|nr:hypothetical protein FA95DRAFT_1612873 [Auriscalpium vulgare]